MPIRIIGGRCGKENSMSKKVKYTPMISCAGRILAIVLGGLMVLSAADCSASPKQEVAQQSKAGQQTFFDTPDQAVSALLEALKNDDDKAINSQ